MICTSVKLQDMFSYSLLPIFLVLGAILAMLLGYILYILVKKLKAREPKAVKEIVIQPKVTDAVAVKKKYLGKLAKVEADYQKGDCSVRIAYQKMSGIIRGFVEEVTGIKVQNCTLQDIKVLKMPVLQALIAEYYSPEFAQKSEGDVMTSIMKTREAIERWN